jgi:hypothetical protein
VENENGLHGITDFYGGANMTLELVINYNNGGTVFSNLEHNYTLNNGSTFGSLTDKQILNAGTFAVSMQTASGIVYPAEKIWRSNADGSKIRLQFDQPLENEIYIIKIYSEIVGQNGEVYGTFIINNTKFDPINLSTAWISVMIFGAFLMLMAAAAYFVPTIMRKVNDNKVSKENAAIVRAKNPDQYTEENENFLTRLKKKLSPKKPNEAAKNEEKPKLEKDAETKKFTDILSENMKRRKLGDASGTVKDVVEKAKKAHEELQQAEKDSFAFLRGYSEPIASVKEEEKIDRSIDAGAVVKDGVTFNPLDSIGDNTGKDGQ